MKNNFMFKDKNNRLKLIAAAQTVLILLSSCSNKDKIETNSSNNNTDLTNNFTIETTETSETFIEENYDFHWGQQENEGFDEYITSKYGATLQHYIYFFGFTDELNIDFTDYVNSHYGTKYNHVPFSKAKYFRSYVSNTDYDYYHRYRDDYEVFCTYYLNESVTTGAFNSKIVISYIVQNNLTFGEMIPIEYLKNFYGDEVYSHATSENVVNNYYVGFYDEGYSYNADELFCALIGYNNAISTLTFSEANPTKNFNTTDPEFVDVCNESKEIFNSYLIQKYGEGCIQLGEVPTEKSFEVMFLGEKMYDFSNIPGAIMNDVQVKGSARVL